MLDISFLIVSIDDCSRQVSFIDELDLDYSYEILVSSKEKVALASQIEHKFFEDDGAGSVSCYNNLYKNSKGKFIACLTGVTLPPRNLNDLIKKMEIKYHNGDDFIITSPVGDSGRSYRIPKWARMIAGITGKNGNAPYIIRYPFFLRDTIDNYLDGVIFAESFVHHYCDNWLGTYCTLIEKRIFEDPDFKMATLPHTSIKENDSHDKMVYEKLCQHYAPHRRRLGLVEEYKYNTKV